MSDKRVNDVLMVNSSRRALYEILGNAVRNTAALGESQAKACPENAATNLPAAEGMKQAASRLAGGRTPAGEGEASALSPPLKSIAISKKPVRTPPPPPKMPTAEDVARALVAAARETQEIGRLFVDLDSPDKLRCRHYAMHALVHCFPGHPRAMYARLVGAPGKQPAKFYDNSKMWVIGSGNRRRTPWWSESAYDRVIRAIEETR